MAARVEGHGREHPGERPVGAAWLLFGVLGPPVAWAVRLGLGYPLVALVCETGWMFLQYLLSGAMALVALAAGVVAYRSWRRARRLAAARGPGDRTSFMGVFGMLSSALFFAAIVVESAALVQLDPCTASTEPLQIRREVGDPERAL